MALQRCGASLEGLLAKGVAGKFLLERHRAGDASTATACRQLRNLGEYEGDLDIDDLIVADLVNACKAVAAKLASLPPLA